MVSNALTLNKIFHKPRVTEGLLFDVMCKKLFSFFFLLFFLIFLTPLIESLQEECEFEDLDTKRRATVICQVFF